MTTRAGVIGSPIAHSLSPAIFRAAFEATGLDWHYDTFDVAADDAVAFLERVRSGELEGISVTMPDKAAVIAGLDGLDDVARDLGAVNCVVRTDAGLWGHNTDGPGLVDSLRIDEGIDLVGCRCALIGAGGAGRAVARALGAAGSEVVVVNRSAERAAEAARLAGALGRVGSVDDVAGCAVVVNATSLGMGDDARLPIAAEHLQPSQVVVDLVYHPAVTPLLRAASERGARTVGGLGMLVHQAAHAFRLWTGAEPPVAAMRSGAERGLAARERS